MSKKNDHESHNVIIAILYVALGSLIVFRIIRTLDAVFSRAPKVKKEKPFAIDTRKGILKGVHDYIAAATSNKNKKSED